MLQWPDIKPDNPSALDEFAIFLCECQFAVQDIEYTNVLEYSKNLRMIVKKLPFYLHDKRRNLVFELKARKEHLTFNVLVSFVKREAKKANDPVFGKSVMSTSTGKDQKNEHQSRSKTTKAFATNVTEEYYKVEFERQILLFENKKNVLRMFENWSFEKYLQKQTELYIL